MRSFDVKAALVNLLSYTETRSTGRARPASEHDLAVTHFEPPPVKHARGVFYKNVINVRQHSAHIHASCSSHISRRLRAQRNNSTSHATMRWQRRNKILLLLLLSTFLLLYNRTDLTKPNRHLVKSTPNTTRVTWQRPNVDVLVKTYVGDAHWLISSLRSITRTVSAATPRRRRASLGRCTQ